LLSAEPDYCPAFFARVRCISQSAIRPESCGAITSARRRPRIRGAPA
jgi:hypothetical protein